MVCLRSRGKKLWSFATGSVIFSSPAVVDGVVYVGADALDALNGEKLWSFAGGASSVLHQW
jgi:outer membrane protein assembly factor BamB